MEHNENSLIKRAAMRFSNYEFRFVNAVQADQEVSVTVNASRHKPGENPTLGNRVSLKADGKLVVAGYKRESRYPLCPASIDLATLGDLNAAQDRAFLPDQTLSRIISSKSL